MFNPYIFTVVVDVYIYTRDKSTAHNALKKKKTIPPAYNLYSQPHTTPTSQLHPLGISEVRAVVCQLPPPSLPLMNRPSSKLYSGLDFFFLIRPRARAFFFATTIVEVDELLESGIIVIIAIIAGLNALREAS